ncbi:MAG: rod shape-determining protein MreD [Phycisphaerae bacterium]|nr:rod shape-determining protein MreD [Phycisphaerae bacterium]
MHWIAFVILLLVVTVLQESVAPFIAVHTIRPDLMVILAVHYALAARTYDALLACWFIGLVIDLTSSSFAVGPNVGLYALSFGLVGLVIVRLRDLTFRESIVTQLFFTFAAKVIVSLLAGVYMLYVVHAPSRFGEILLTGIYAAVYTAVLAPYGHWALRRLRRPLGIGATHRLRVR